MLTQWPFKKGPSRILSPQCCQGIPPVPTVQHDQRRSHCYPLPYASIKANNLIDGGNQFLGKGAVQAHAARLKKMEDGDEWALSNWCGGISARQYTNNTTRG